MTAATTRRRRCWCGRGVALEPADAIECAEHDRPGPISPPTRTPITQIMTFPQVGPPSAPLPPATSRSDDAGDSPSPDRVTTSPACRACGGDGFLFHLFEGAVELDGPCPACTRQESAA